jgi:hypothetical protein
MSALAPIIPVIAKADCMTISERNIFVHQLATEFARMQDQLDRSVIYDFGDIYMQNLDFSDTDTPMDDIDEASAAFLKIGSFLHAQSSTPNLEKNEDTFQGTTDVEAKNDVNASIDSDVKDLTSSFLARDRPPFAISGIVPQLGRENIERVKDIFSIVCDTSGSRVYPWGDVR